MKFDTHDRIDVPYRGVDPEYGGRGVVTMHPATMCARVIDNLDDKYVTPVLTNAFHRPWLYAGCECVLPASIIDL